MEQPVERRVARACESESPWQERASVEEVRTFCPLEPVELPFLALEFSLSLLVLSRARLAQHDEPAALVAERDAGRPSLLVGLILPLSSSSRSPRFAARASSRARSCSSLSRAGHCSRAKDRARGSKEGVRRARFDLLPRSLALAPRSRLEVLQLALDSLLLGVHVTVDRERDGDRHPPSSSLRDALAAEPFLPLARAFKARSRSPLAPRAYFSLSASRTGRARRWRASRASLAARRGGSSTSARCKKPDAGATPRPSPASPSRPPPASPSRAP